MKNAGPNLTIGTLLFLFVFGVATASLFGLAQLVDSDDPPAAAANGDNDGDVPVVPGGPVTLELAAQNIEFDRRVLTVGSGAEVTVVLDNQDAGVQHNFAVYTNSSAGEAIFQGEIFAGPDVLQEQFTAPEEPGTYFFRCDVHPDTMTGSFNVR